jgi:hypothetical protein
LRLPTEDFDEPSVPMDVCRLFGTGTRSAILYLLAASDELDGAVVADILAQHERGNIYRALRRLRAWAGLVGALGPLLWMDTYYGRTFAAVLTPCGFRKKKSALR